MDKRVADFTLDPQRLFLLGIIINELLTNAIKYAFNDRRAGRITISLAPLEGRIALVIQDDGPGLPDGFEAQNSKGFGLMLVKMLSQQLKGRLAIENRERTRCGLEFPL